MAQIWYLHLNPFFWEGVVFALFGLITGLSVHAIFGFPRRLIESI